MVSAAPGPGVGPGATALPPMRPPALRPPGPRLLGVGGGRLLPEAPGLRPPPGYTLGSTKRVPKPHPHLCPAP